MQKYLLAIDCGTTNTRIRLLDENGNVIHIKKAETGVRNTAMDGNNSRLKGCVSTLIKEILAEKNLTLDNIDRILASGMITSEVGLYTLPHLTAPVGYDEIRNGMKSVMLADVCEKEITFIPGIKNNGNKMDFDNFEQMDIMRGEEVEALCVLSVLPKGEEYVLILPGSHTKIIPVDKNSKITGCITTMAGELLSVLTTGTIIAGSVESKFANEKTYNRDMVLLGNKTSKQVGISRAAFGARLLKVFKNESGDDLASYLLGAALAEDVRAMKNSTTTKSSENVKCVVVGKEPFKSAFVDILNEEKMFKEIITIDKKLEENLSARGVYLLNEGKGI